MDEADFRPVRWFARVSDDWIVLPDREPSVIRLRPLTTSLADEIGLFLPLEGPQISSAEFSPPGPERPGDATGVMTLFNATASIFDRARHPSDRSGRISVTPRPYQFVPLIIGPPARSSATTDCGRRRRRQDNRGRNDRARAFRSRHRQATGGHHSHASLRSVAAPASRKIRDRQLASSCSRRKSPA